MNRLAVGIGAVLLLPLFSFTQETTQNRAAQLAIQSTRNAERSSLDALANRVVPTEAIKYVNEDYSFCFTLPVDWLRFSVLEDHWEGWRNVEPKGSVTVEQGPLIKIRHPRWTSADPRQDIPIMVFTHTQWYSVLHPDSPKGFLIGAAPFGPGELGRNSSYVFALPARYNYAFPEGYEEVDKILRNKPLDAHCKSNTGEAEHTQNLALWLNLQSEIEAELARHQMVCETGSNWKVRVADVADITGDGVAEAAIDWCNGGAYTDWLILMRLEGGRPVLARSGRNGLYSYIELASGSSVRHSASYEFHPEQKAIYSIALDIGAWTEKSVAKDVTAHVDVLVWNQKTKTFDWDRKLSQQESAARTDRNRRR
jgi:hypothetical protein